MLKFGNFFDKERKMDMIEGLLKSGLADGLMKQMGAQSGLDSSNLNAVIAKIAPVLMKKANENFKGEQDSSDLVALIEKSELSNLNESAKVESGNDILGQLLGSKDASRALASEVGSKLGIDAGAIKKMLPMIANLVAGGLNKQTSSLGLKSGDTSGISAALAGFLDKNGDGNIADDLLRMASSFFGKK